MDDHGNAVDPRLKQKKEAEERKLTAAERAVQKAGAPDKLVSLPQWSQGAPTTTTTTTSCPELCLLAARSDVGEPNELEVRGKNRHGRNTPFKETSSVS